MRLPEPNRRPLPRRPRGAGRRRARAAFGVAVSGGPDSLALLLLAQAAFPGQVGPRPSITGCAPKAPPRPPSSAKSAPRLGIPHATLDRRRADRRQRPGRAPARCATACSPAGRAERGHRLAAHRPSSRRPGRDPADAPAARRRPRRPRRHPRRAPRSRACRSSGPCSAGARAELAEIVAAAGPRRRSRIRATRTNATTAPACAGASPRRTGSIPPPLARSAAALAEAEDALDWAVERLIEERVESAPGGLTFDPAGLPAELRRRALLRLLALLAPADAAARRRRPAPARHARGRRDRDPGRRQMRRRRGLALHPGPAPPRVLAPLRPDQRLVERRQEARAVRLGEGRRPAADPVRAGAQVRHDRPRRDRRRRSRPG